MRVHPDSVLLQTMVGTTILDVKIHIGGILLDLDASSDFNQCSLGEQELLEILEYTKAELSCLARMSLQEVIDLFKIVAPYLKPEKKGQIARFVQEKTREMCNSLASLRDQVSPQKFGHFVSTHEPLIDFYNSCEDFIVSLSYQQVERSVHTT